MTHDRPSLNTRRRQRIVLTIVVVFVAFIGIEMWTQAVRREQAQWSQSVQSLGVQTYAISPLYGPEVGLGEVLHSVLMQGSLEIIVSDDEDASRLIAHPGDCPRRSFIVVGRAVSERWVSALADRYPAARLTTAAALYSGSTFERTAFRR